MRISMLISRVFLLLLLFVVSGCGGGGNDEQSPAVADVETNTDTDETPSADDPQPVATDPVAEEPVTDTVTDPVVDNPAFGSIENLFGQVTFRYRVTGSSNDAESSVHFAASGEGDTLYGGRTVFASTNQQESYNCLEITFAVQDFLCVRSSAFDNTNEVFFFAMDSQFVGSGAYEFCEGTPEACGNDVVLSPDGTVDVTVSRNAIAVNSSSSLNGESISSTELRDFMKADVLQFGGVDSSAQFPYQNRELENTLKLMMQNLH